MKRTEKNKVIYQRISKEISDIQGITTLSDDMNNIFENIQKIDSLHFKDIIKSFNNNTRSLNPFVARKKEEGSINEEIKIGLSKVLSDIESTSPKLEKPIEKTDIEYQYKDQEIMRIEDKILNLKNSRMIEGANAEKNVKLAREFAFNGVDMESFSGFCNNEKRRLIPALKDIEITNDDIIDFNVTSYRRLSKKAKFKYYIWVYITCFFVVALSIAGLIMLLTIK